MGLTQIIIVVLNNYLKTAKQCPEIKIYTTGKNFKKCFIECGRRDVIPAVATRVATVDTGVKC